MTFGNIHSYSAALRMKTVTPVSEILHKSQRQSFVSYKHIPPVGPLRKDYRIPVKIGKSSLTVHVNRRESVFAQHQGQGKVCIRDKYGTLDHAYGATGRNNMKILLKNAHHRSQ